MPEGPEIAIIAKVLNVKCKDKRILNIVVHRDSKYKSDSRFKPCIGKIIKGVQFKGKKIIFILNDNINVRTNNAYLLSSLALEGRWNLEDNFPIDIRHLSVSLELQDSKGNENFLLFRDVRHFGDLSYCKDDYELDSKLESVGPSWIPSDLFPERITLRMFTEFLQYNYRIKNKQIMMFLMDQKYTSGVGNYIRAEALYIARIDPKRTIGSLNSDEIEKIYIAINNVMTEALKAGGHTLKSYFTPVGNKGGYEPLVYGRTKALDTGEKVIREFDAQKRTIHWVPSLQH
jgi:formamidopyrimidine-DNA glycosylase